jgi:hypothetical protein
MSDCWIYAGATDRHGYPQLTHMVEGKKKTTMIHKAMYQTERGEIPAGMTLDHKCRVTTCINPAHLEPVTLKENILRGDSPWAVHARKTACVNGHPFDEENTGRDNQGARYCKTCRRKHINNWWAARRAAGLTDKEQA